MTTDEVICNRTIECLKLSGVTDGRVRVQGGEVTIVLTEDGIKKLIKAVMKGCILA